MNLDITFCVNKECTNKECKRNLKYRADVIAIGREISVCDFTKECKNFREDISNEQ